MATGSVEAVKELRERTGAGMMDCKAALQASSGDIEKAIDFLRKKGMAHAAKRAGREAKEGLVVVCTTGAKAVLVEANCETDFVARTDDFRNLANLAADEVLAHGESAISSPKCADRIAELSGKIGEKILIKRTKLFHSETGLIFSYVHSNHKLGVVVEIACGKPESRKNPALEEFGKNIAMQVAAGNPICVSRAEVPQPILEREKAIFKEEVKDKPAAIVDKIVQGKLGKFYQASCLLEQPFIKDDKMSVQKLMDETAKKIGGTITIKQFVRFQLGETAAS